jgi:UDP-2,3-diacylglucosamine pyrophosphatase LpxH
VKICHPDKRLGFHMVTFQLTWYHIWWRLKFEDAKKCICKKNAKEIQYDAYNWVESSYNIIIYFCEIAQVTQACCGCTHPNCINVCQNVLYIE